MLRNSKKKEKPKKQDIAKEKEQVAQKDEKEPQRKRRKRIEKPREPNPRGALLTLISFCLLYIAISANVHNPAVLGTSDSNNYEKQQAEKAKAEENIKNDLEGTADGIRGNFTETNPVDQAVASVDKVNHDVEALKKLPAQTVETVRNMKIGDAAVIVMDSIKRLSKIYSDAKKVHKDALKQVEKLE